MGFNVKLLFKSKVIIAIIMVTIMAFTGIIITTIENLKLDREHMALIEYSKNIEIEISHSRIFLDDYFLFIDTLKRKEVLKSLNRAKANVSEMDRYIREKNGSPKKSSLVHELSGLKLRIGQLTSLITTGFRNNSETIDTVIQSEYNNFQDAYQRFDKNLHNYISSKNSSFEKKIFALLISIFGILMLSVIIIIRLLNEFRRVEKQQANKTIEVEYKERKRIAADLHDGLGSTLSSIDLFIKLIETNCIDKNNIRNLKQVRQLSNMALENLEAAINNLNPSVLNRYGLIKSLEILCEKIDDLEDVSCKINAENFDIKLTKNMEINIYRICNELIHNTLKHANATSIDIGFENIRKRIYFVYRDNGKGFNTNLIPSNKAEKMGLRNIINRVESFGGTYTIDSEIGKGIEISFQFNV